MAALVEVRRQGCYEGTDEVAYHRHLAARHQVGDEPGVDLHQGPGPVLGDGLDERLSVPEVVLDGEVVLLVRRQPDVPQRHRLDATLGEEAFGSENNELPGGLPRTLVRSRPLTLIRVV